MKIVIPIFCFGKGGGNRVLSELANNWQKQGHDVCFLTFSSSSLPRFPTSAKIIWIDKKSCSVDFNSEGAFKLTAFAEVLKLRKGIERYCSDADIVIANQALTAYSVRFANVEAKKFYYVQANEAGYEFAYSSIKNKVAGFISFLTYKLNLKYIVNSPIYFNLYGIQAVAYIPPGIDYEIFGFRERIINKESFTIGCVGRFEIFKGTIYVYRAFVQLKKAGYPVKLRVAFGMLDNIDSEFKDDIEVCNPQCDVELSEFYKGIDILVSPGSVQFYAHHYPVMEAMACGTPTITTGYLPADNSNSWIVPPKSPKDIVSRVLDIIEHPEVVHKKLMLAHSNVAVYKWPEISKKFIEIFTQY